MTNHRQLFIGPMSTNIVDVIKTPEFSDKIGLIPSRRQVDTSPRGYVNNWSTLEFLQYTSNTRLVRCRDHAGPLQGSLDDDGLESIANDVSHENFFEIVHIDPWKSVKDIEHAANSTTQIIDFCHLLNSNVLFEIGTEQGIRPYDIKEFEKFLTLVERGTGDKFKNVIYGVIQGGTILKGAHNAGQLNEDKCAKMVQVCKKFGLLSKEHNGDYLSQNDIVARFSLGLDSINIAPEFGNIETNLILDHLDDKGFEEFFDICYASKKWIKWLPSNFQVENREDQRKIIEVAGHYVFSQNTFKDLKMHYEVSDDVIKLKHEQRIREILSSIEKGKKAFENSTK